jgi:dolichol kinase
MKNNDGTATDVVPSMMYPLVALSGSIGCLVTCGAVSFTMNLGRQTKMMLPWYILRLLFNIIGPLLAVEFSLSWVGLNFDDSTMASQSPIPIPSVLSLQWMYMFLLEEEHGYPLYLGLIYWFIVLAVTSIPTYYLLSLPSQKLSVVVTRKWFHLIAVLLFAPITHQFPQLMSLSYAIAVCVLLVLETLRRDISWLQSFYTTFLDDTKDDGSRIIVSHMFLILGCAAPLWVCESINNGHQQSSLLFVSLFGVLCIGIGDAMGAVVGKSIGKYTWGTNQRTLEGSLAMWLSMMLAGTWLCHSGREFWALLVATTFTTILEAFTLQLDNLALPLAGCAVVLMLL